MSEVAIAPEIASSVGDPPEAKSIFDGIAEAAPTGFAQDALAELGAMASNTVDQSTDLDGPCRGVDLGCARALAHVLAGGVDGRQVGGGGL